MGVYVYALSVKTVPVVIDGQIAQVNLVRFSHKPTFSFASERRPAWEKMADARLARLDNVWAKRPAPQYVVYADPGDDLTNRTVLTGWPQGVASCYDDRDDLRPVGRITGRAGKAWSLRRYIDIPIARSVQSEPDFNTRLQGIFDANDETGSYLRSYNDEPDLTHLYFLNEEKAALARLSFC